MGPIKKNCPTDPEGQKAVLGTTIPHNSQNQKKSHMDLMSGCTCMAAGPIAIRFRDIINAAICSPLLYIEQLACTTSGSHGFFSCQALLHPCLTCLIPPPPLYCSTPVLLHPCTVQQLSIETFMHYMNCLLYAYQEVVCAQLAFEASDLHNSLVLFVFFSHTEKRQSGCFLRDRDFKERKNIKAAISCTCVCRVNNAFGSALHIRYVIADFICMTLQGGQCACLPICVFLGRSKWSSAVTRLTVLGLLSNLVI